MAAESLRVRFQVDSNTLTSDDMMSTVLRFNNEFPIINQPDGDTLVYIGPPPQGPGQSTKDYERLLSHYSQPHRMYSHDFRAMKSIVFENMLGPKSIKTERRLRKEGILSRVNTSGIKFYLDLRPPTEDDDALILLTELTCTKGVRLWHKAQNHYKLGQATVGGHDDSAMLPSDCFLVPSASRSKEQSESLSKEDVPTPDISSRLSTDGRDSSTVQVTTTTHSAPTITTHCAPTLLDMPLQPEYSQLRHRSAIERLIQAISGADPKLDSAPKVWTYFAVAKFFHCATEERVNKWIKGWLFSGRNYNFLQNNPEVTYRIGLGTQNIDVTKDAFAILVGEKALLNVYGEADPRVLTSLKSSVSGREMAHLDDDERNRIDHAAASFVRRIRAKFDSLVGEEMSWLQESRQYSKLTNVVARSEEDRAVFDHALTCVKDYVRGRILWIQCRMYNGDPREFDNALSRVGDFRPGTPNSFHVIYNNLNWSERMFTRFFWFSLQHEKLSNGDQNTWSGFNGEHGRHEIVDRRLSDQLLLARMSNGEKLIRKVTLEGLKSALADCNIVLDKYARQDAEKYGSTTPEKTAGRTLTSPKYESSWRAATHRKRSSISDLSAIRGLTLSGQEEREDTITKMFSLEKRRKISNDSTDLKAETARYAKGSGVPSISTEDLEDITDRVPEHEFYGGLPHLGGDGELIPGSYPSLASNKAGSAGDLAPYGNQARMQFGQEMIAMANLQNQDDNNVPSTAGLGKNNGRTERLPPPQPVNGLDPFPATLAYPRDDYSYMMSGRSAHPPGTSAAVQTWVDANIQSDPMWEDQEPMDIYSLPGIYGTTVFCGVLLEDITNVLRKICDDIMLPPHLFYGEDQVPTNLIDVLMCLADDEWKYLPLWAGGNDDGSGGVFDEVDVPNLEGGGGFKGGKRGMRGVVGGFTSESSVSGSENFSDIGSEAVSTVGRASKDATDGTETVKSLSTTGSEEGFMQQNELWDEIRNMKSASAGATVVPQVAGRDGIEGGVMMTDDEVDDETLEEADEEDDIDTIVGAASTGHNEIVQDHDSDFDNSDMEIIDEDDL